MGSADDLSGYIPIGTASTWDYSVGPLRCSLVRGLFRHQQYRGMRRDWTAYSGSGRWVCFTGQPHTMQEYKGQGSKVPLYLGFKPADGLSVELEGWTSAYRIASVGCSLTRCTPPWRSECADVIISAPLQGRLIYSNSRVHGNRTLYAEARSYHYKLYILVGF